MKTSDSTPEHEKSIGIWIRVSTEDQAQGDSPAHHEARARHYAASKGWTVEEVYDLAGVSGKSVMDHPESKRMLEDIRRGHISALLFSKLARLTRNARELMDFSDFFRQHNADLVSLQENIDTSTPSGRLFYNMVAVMAQWEREEISDRVKASVAIRAKLGKPLNGKAPFGYVWKDKKLQPHLEEGPVRKLMYELFAEHQRKKTVARLLNERGYRTRGGSRFTDTSVDRLIRDTTAKGVLRANFTRRVAHNKPWALKPEHDWVLSDIEPIISPELWEKCNSLLESRRTTQQRPTKRVAHLFAGLTFCECGTKMYVPSNSPKYICTACRNKIPEIDLEGIFLDELKSYLLSPEKVGKYISDANAIIGDKTGQLETLQKELQKAVREAERIYQLYMAEGLTPQQFKELYNPNDIRKKQLEAEIPRLQAEIDLLKIDGLSSEYIASEAKDLAACWPSMSHQERRSMIESLVKKITIGKDEIDISLCYLPSFKEMSNGQRSLCHALPFCHLSLKGLRPSVGPYQKQIMGCPDNPKTIGEHLKKRRIELGLKQTEVAPLLGVHRGSIQLWEQGRGEQGVRSFPSIIRFLGYIPFECDGTPGGRFAFLRQCSGKTQEELAELTSCDPSSIARWENGMTEGAKKVGAATARLLEELKKSGIAETVKRSLPTPR